MASKAEVEVEVKSSADKFWRALRDSTDLFPKIFPDEYKSIEIVEGDGKSAGTIRLLKYAEGSITRYPEPRILFHLPGLAMFTCRWPGVHLGTKLKFLFQFYKQELLRF